jgi:predicted DNA-binding protein (MmcQ/YjbR family)
VKATRPRAAGPSPLARLRRICRRLPEVSETVSWGHPNFRVGRQTFCVLEPYRGHLTLVLKPDPVHRSELLEDERFFVTPYIGTRGWVSMILDGRPSWKRIEALVRESYAEVARDALCTGGRPVRARPARGKPGGAKPARGRPS